VRSERKQTIAMTQGGNAHTPEIVQPAMGGKSWPALAASGAV